MLIILVCRFSAAPGATAQDRGQNPKPPTGLGAEPRLALVIGNAAYKEAPLTNPLNDARDMAEVLRSVGFEVLSGIDRNQRQMKELIRQFGLKLRQGGVGLFYFAGHGVQVGGRNYLLPIGAEINAEAEVEFEAVEAGFVLAQMEEARNRLNIVILDACRNNPFTRSFMRGRSDTRGLAGVRSAPSGTLIAYATAADDVAADGAGRNGLFTGELLAQMRTPGLSLAQVFQRTRTSVRNKSGGRQVPFEYTSVEGDEEFYFIRPNAPPPVVSAEQAAWERARQRGTVEAVRGFLSLYAGGQFENEARALLATLEREAAPASSSNTPSSATPAKPTPTPVAARLSVAGVPLVAFGFTTASVDASGKVVNRRQEQAWGFTEDLGGVLLEMVEVPGGEFLMGSPDSEAHRSSDEGPQQRVRVAGFAMGKYEVTQAQWRAVAKLPKVKIDLKPKPANFKGDNLPVERVSWDEALEFCERLKRKAGRAYRLPTEAEWEYAARAGTTTPFAFGPTITPDIVNYNGDYPYGAASKGSYRKQTVPVGSLGVANAFGLFDLHGNVWEWCQDVWHENYAGVPTDGSAWLSGGDSSRRVLRGGSWIGSSADCRSALRGFVASGAIPDLIGLRLVSALRTP